jgi:hypothetical protein
VDFFGTEACLDWKVWEIEPIEAHNTGARLNVANFKQIGTGIICIMHMIPESRISVAR